MAPRPSARNKRFLVHLDHLFVLFCHDRRSRSARTRGARSSFEMSAPIPLSPRENSGNSAENPSTRGLASDDAHGIALASTSLNLRSSHAIEMASNHQSNASNAEAVSAAPPSASEPVSAPKNHALVFLRNAVCLALGFIAMRYAETVYAQATDSMALGGAFDRQLKHIVLSAMLYLVASRILLFCDLSHFRALTAVFLQTVLFLAPLFVCMSLRTADYLAPKNSLTNLSQEYIIILFAIVELVLYAVASGCFIALKFFSMWQIAGIVSIFWAAVAMLTWSNLTAVCCFHFFHPCRTISCAFGCCRAILLVPAPQ